VTTRVDLIVRASEDCWTDPLLQPQNRGVVWDRLDMSLLWVQVEVKDINDNAPRLSKQWFTAGVSEDTQVGATVLNLAVSILPPWRMGRRASVESISLAVQRCSV